MRLTFFVLLLSTLLGIAPVMADDAPPVPQPVVHATLTSNATQILPGQPVEVNLELTMPPEWHVYSDPPGDAGLATSITWTLPEGFTAGPIEWPAPQTMQEGTLTVNGYTERVALPVHITPPQDVSAAPYTLQAVANWLVCHDICIPESATLTLVLPVSITSAPAAPPAESVTFFSALLLALAGGLMLNLMPCVFPVLSLKCLAVARHKHIKRERARAEGIAYTLGVLTCFGAIAGALLVFKAGGEAIGWGYQMQSPMFVSGLALLLFAIGLNLSGLFDLPVLFGNIGNVLTREPTLPGSFATGALATLVATPCTAPFMAAAVGYALMQSAIPALLIFEMIGLGLALPFLLVSLFPGLLRLLPRPGRWMESFRQFLAFPMYLSALWLLWVLAQQAGANAVAFVTAAALGIAFILWMKRFFVQGSLGYRILAVLCVIAIVVEALQRIHPTAGTSTSSLLHGGEAYDAGRLAQLRMEGTPVFLDATAAWCITCQVNYHTTLGIPEVRSAFTQKHVVFMVADWTRADPAITALLEQFGHKGVPMYVYFPPQGEPRVLPQLLTPSIVLGTME